MQCNTFIVHCRCINQLLNIFSGVPRSDQSSGDVTSPTATGADRKWVPSDNATAESRTGPNIGIVPDSQQLFVGNLPHNVDDKELVEFFTSKWLVLPNICKCQLLQTDSCDMLTYPQIPLV